MAIVSTFYKIEPQHILVVHDELDLPLGRIKLKVGGGTAGHNGLKSIAERIGSKDFYRLRMGIGKPERGETTGWVLGGFAPDEMAAAREIIDAAASGILDWLERPPGRGHGAGQRLSRTIRGNRRGRLTFPHLCQNPPGQTKRRGFWAPHAGMDYFRHCEYTIRCCGQ